MDNFQKEFLVEAKNYIERQGHIGIKWLMKEKDIVDDNKALGLAALLISEGKYRIYEGVSHDEKEIWIIKDSNYPLVQKQITINRWIVAATIATVIVPIVLEILKK